MGFLIYRFTRKPEPPVKPPATDDTPLAEANKELREQAARLTDEDLLFLTGQLVVERLGSYQTWDENYKNIRSVQSYVTENLNQRLEKIMARVVEPDAPQFEQRKGAENNFHFMPLSIALKQVNVIDAIRLTELLNRCFND